MPTTIRFVDIAGLVRGASKGEGLGNQFLSHIREVDAMAHVVRCFKDENVTHVEGKVDPVSDVDTIHTELGLKDLDTVNKRLDRARKQSKGGDAVERAAVALCEKLAAHLDAGKPARTFERRGRHRAGASCASCRCSRTSPSSTSRTSTRARSATSRTTRTTRR